MRALLAHTVVDPPHGTPSRTVFFLHGIMGSGRNWRSFAGRLTEARPDLRAVLVDLRNHGDSHPADPPHTLEACAGDLARLAEHLGAPAVVSGHSFGGKVALAYARRHPERLAETWVLDCPPGAADILAEDSTELGLVIQTLESLSLPVPRRGVVTDHFMAAGFSRGIGGWMSTNTRTVPGGFTWSFDLDAVRAMIADYWQRDCYPFLDDHPDSTTVHVVEAARSDRWTDADRDRLRDLAARDRIRHHVLPDASHWLHVDNPDGLVALMAEGIATEERA